MICANGACKYHKPCPGDHDAPTVRLIEKLPSAPCTPYDGAETLCSIWYKEVRRRLVRFGPVQMHLCSDCAAVLARELRQVRCLPKGVLRRVLVWLTSMRL